MKQIEVIHTGGASWKQIREVVSAHSLLSGVAKVQQSGQVRDDDIVSVRVIQGKNVETLGIMQA